MPIPSRRQTVAAATTEEVMDERLVPFGLADIAKAFEDQQRLADANVASGSPSAPADEFRRRRVARGLALRCSNSRASTGHPPMFPSRVYRPGTQSFPRCGFPYDLDIGRIDAIDRVRIGVVRLLIFVAANPAEGELAKPSTATIIASFQTILTLLNQVIRLSSDPAIEVNSYKECPSR